MPKGDRYCFCDDCHNQENFFNCTDVNPFPRHDIMGEGQEVCGTFGFKGCGATIFIQNRKSDNDLIYFPLGKLDESSKFVPDAYTHGFKTNLDCDSRGSATI